MEAIGVNDVVNWGISAAGAVLAIWGSIRVVETRLEAQSKRLDSHDEHHEKHFANHMAAQTMHLENRERMQAIMTEVQRNFVTGKHFDQVVQELKEERKATNEKLDRVIELIMKKGTA